MRSIRTRYIVLVVSITALTLINIFLPKFVVYVRKPRPVDPHATRLTRNLFDNLRVAASHGKTMLGMDQATIQGEFARLTPCGEISEKKLDGYHSDIRTICGEGPGIYGFDLLKITSEWLETEPYRSNPNITDEMKDYMKEHQRKLIRSHIRKIHGRGGVTTIHWHINNPLADVQTSYNKGTLDQLWQIVPRHVCFTHRHMWTAPTCGAAHKKFKAKVDEAIAFLNSLTVIKNESAPEGEDDINDNDKEIEYIPIILRLFHEQNGNWFWWGVPSGSDSNLKKSWKFRMWQIAYREVWGWVFKHFLKHGRHNILWATGPNSDFLTRESYLAYSPPISQVDILGFDAYGDFQRDFPQTELRMVVRLAESLGKIPAATELGYNGGDRREWPPDVWSDHVLGPALNERIAWILMWDNVPTPGQCGGTYFGPHLGHSNADDFKTICKHNDVMMEGQHDYFDIPKEAFKPILKDNGSKCKKKRETCKKNGGRGYGKVWICDGGYFCADQSLYSECKCRISGIPKASNGLDFCLWNKGCGFGFRSDCVTGSSVACAKTNNSYTKSCVSFCPERPLCKKNGGRGETSIFPCPENDDDAGTKDDYFCAREMVVDGEEVESNFNTSTSNKSKPKEGICRVDEKSPPIASNNIQFCIANEGCGYGDKWACGGGHICAKTDTTFKVPCVAFCPETCPSPPFPCEGNSGRGDGTVVKCKEWSAYTKPGFCVHKENERGWWKAKTDATTCDCKIYGEPIAPNGYPYCMENGGCGFGESFDCPTSEKTKGLGIFGAWLSSALNNLLETKSMDRADGSVCAFSDWTQQAVCASMC